MLTKIATLVAFLAVLAACQGQNPDDVDLLAAASALDIPELSCGPHGVPNGKPAELTGKPRFRPATAPISNSASACRRPYPAAIFTWVFRQARRRRASR